MGTLSCTHTQPCGWHGQRGFPRVSWCLHQGCLRALFSSLKTACSPSTAYHQGEHPHQIFRICGYMVNSVFNFLIDTGLCWSLFSLLRPTQKEERVCFYSKFQGVVRHGSGAEHGSGKKRGRKLVPTASSLFIQIKVASTFRMDPLSSS